MKRWSRVKRRNLLAYLEIRRRWRVDRLELVDSVIRLYWFEVQLLR